MKNIYTKIALSIFVLTVIGNVMIFVSSMKLGVEVHEFEQKTYALTQENVQLDKEMADTESFLHTDVYKQQWGFKQASQPVYIGQLQYALNTKR